MQVLSTCPYSGTQINYLLLLPLYSTIVADVINEERIENLEKKLNDLDFLEKKFEDLARHLMLTELAIGEKSRSEYSSGVKQIRNTNDGTKSYFQPTHTYNSVGAFHEHPDYDKIIGMGEIIAILNGVEFRTRHNDYPLKMPSETSTDYNAKQNIQFPPVPPTVLQKQTVRGQILELQSYFRAFANQDYNIRDYRPYFKPILCYLEGAWTTNTKTLNEPFESDRHHIDATTWFDLQEKIRFTSYSGLKHNLENFSYLPTTIMNVVNGTPVYAQWNYRIVCHPLKHDLPLSAFKPVDNMAARIGHKWNMTRFVHSRAARFVLASDARKTRYNRQNGYGDFTDKMYTRGLLDELMAEIPGKDNYPGILHDTTFGMEALDPRYDNDTALNTAYYHRYLKYNKNGTFNVHKGFSDNNLFVAQTTSPHIAEMKTEYCHVDATTNRDVCQTEAARYSYAIPIEVIYLTPLMTWNPYNLERHDRRNKNIVEANGRDGGFSKTKAYNGNSFKKYYRTPAEFFRGSNDTTVDRDVADTDEGIVGVLDRGGNVRKVISSGVRIILPEIPGVGQIRMRYPIMPITSEGNQIGKEVEAVKEVLNHLVTMGTHLQETPRVLKGGNIQADAYFRTSATNQDPPGHHFHELYIPQENMLALAKGEIITTVTTTDNAHNHNLKVYFDQNAHKYFIRKCDATARCWDGHAEELNRVN